MSPTFAASHRFAAIAFAAFVASSALAAQQPAPAAPAAPAFGGPSVGDVAPDFSLPGATRYGTLRDAVSLSSFRGNTVVLAFFIKARTRG